MDPLRANASLRHLQAYVAKLEADRGFADQSAIQKRLLMGEELGELFKAVRKHEGLPIDPEGTTQSVAWELADLLIYIWAVANRYDVDLEDAFREKERVNAERVWKTDG